MGGQAASDLSDATASLDCLSAVPAGGAFPCAVSVRGLGDALSVPLQLRLEVPRGVLHAGHEPGGTFDADLRLVTFNVGPKTPRTFRVDLIADPGMSGAELTLAARLHEPGSRAALGRDALATVHVARQATLDVGVAVLPVTPIWPFLGLLLSIPLGAAIVYGLRRGRRAAARAPRRPGYAFVPKDSVMPPVILSLVCAAFAVMAAPQAIESVRSLRTFVETRCTILDRTGASSFSDDPQASIAVLRYTTPAGTRVSAGFDVRGTIGRGGNATAYEAFAIGRDYPCWFDPERPERVVLRRGPSFGAWMTLILVLALAWALSRAVRAWRA